jgi:hypothetical protein
MTPPEQSGMAKREPAIKPPGRSTGIIGCTAMSGFGVSRPSGRVPRRSLDQAIADLPAGDGAGSTCPGAVAQGTQ